jgi:hypothetical protein
MAPNGDQARVLLSKVTKDEALARKIGSDTDIADEIIGSTHNRPSRMQSRRLSRPTTSSMASAITSAT